MSLHIDLVVGACVCGGGPSVVVVTGRLSHGSQPLVNTSDHAVGSSFCSDRWAH